MNPSLLQVVRRTMLAVVVSASLPSLANACSMRPVTIQRSRNSITFIGTALADTVQAGPGDVQYVSAGGQFGPARDRIIFGQRVSVERLTEVDRARLPVGARQVILIPWANDMSCQPMPWAQSARWLAPGTRGIYNAQLRAVSHWIQGVPTLDVMASLGVPYQGNTKAESSAPNAQWLSIDELFEIVPLLPDPELLRADPEAASQPLLQWAERNPAISERPPAKLLVLSTAHDLSSIQLQRVRPDIGGTWRFTVNVPGDAERVFFGRTDERPTSDWPTSFGPTNRKAWEVPENEGFYVSTSVHPSLNKLPASCAQRGAESYMAQRVVSRTAKSAGIVGDLDLGLVNAAFSGEPGFMPFKTGRETESSAATIEAVFRGGARFENGTDGVMHVSQRYELKDGRTLTLSAERIARDVVRCEY